MDNPLACARVRVLLEPFVDGDLDANVAEQVRRHLVTCAECRRQHDQAISLPFRLKALSSPAPRASFAQDVMRAVAPARSMDRQVWTLLAPEALLAGFILWYLSGLEGLSSIASGTFNDLLGLAGGSLPSVPPVDVVLVIALIALTCIAGYHLSLLIRVAPTSLQSRRHA
ncbi:MAG TPA: zf-HC2 domain-containing protein [Candidatus Dormibacteraeota bacterium]|nr:zf-HC2 domain-containing protein [Candidatus Dormibacteraeota bacterium]